MVDIAVDGKKYYFEILYDFLKENQYIYDRHMNLKWRRDFERYYRYYDWDEKLCERIKQQYGYNARNVLLVNSKKFYVIAQYYRKTVVVSNLRIAIVFLLLGCLLDHLLDAGDEKQKEIARKKLSWTYCGEYFMGATELKEDDVIDELYSELACAFSQIHEETPIVYVQLLENIKIAVSAELNAVSISASNDEQLIMNKSALFVLIAGMIGMYDMPNLKEITEFFWKMGEIFAIIDDLCDFYEDRENGQKNMVNMLIMDEGEENAIKRLITRLNDTMNQIENTMPAQIYMLLLMQVQEWTMSNDYLRERIWLENG